MNRLHSRLRGNPTLLTLLRHGARVTFPDEFYLQGEPEVGYIETGSPLGSTGLRILDRDGVAQALRDLDYDRRPVG